VKKSKKIIVVHSGGMDSSICLALAIKEYGAEAVLSMSFTYGQRHANEIARAIEICHAWKVEHTLINIDCLQKITDNSLTNPNLKIKGGDNSPPNTLVVGRNGLMARIAAIHAESLKAERISMGIIGVEAANSGYRDCTRQYMNLMEEILRLDFDNPQFCIETPVVSMTKKETMECAYQLGVLEFLLEKTITCYEGVSGMGCQVCPSCNLRNAGIKDFLQERPEVTFSYRQQFDLKK
jgi:7-cyano-7-deazaguanine synthase